MVAVGRLGKERSQDWKKRLTFHPWCIKGRNEAPEGATPFSDVASSGAAAGRTGGRRGLRANQTEMVFKTFHEITKELGHERVDVLKVCFS